MTALLQVFLDICLFRRTPQDLPASGLLLGITLAAHTLFSAALSLPSYAWFAALAAGVLDTVVLVGLTLLMLGISRHVERSVKTLTAMAGTGAVISFVALVPIFMIHTANQAGANSELAVLLLVGMVIWSIAVMAFIFRHALSSGPFTGLAVAIAFYWLAVIIRNAAFPV